MTTATQDRPGIHYADLATSKRLQRVMALLEDGGWHTPMGIIHGARVTAVNTALAELRRNGVAIERQHVKGQIYRYRLARKGTA